MNHLLEGLGMKKLLTLLLAAGMFCSAAAPSQAVELKVSGKFDFTFQRLGNIQDFIAHNGEEKFSAKQRLRFNMDVIVSEQLSATLQLQVGTGKWGVNDNPIAPNGYALSDTPNVMARHAYLDWIVPNTEVKVRMGLQSWYTPSYVFGAIMLDDTATGVNISSPLGQNASGNLYWIRATAPNAFANVLGKSMTSDFIGGDLTYSGNGFAITPWFMVGAVGNAAKELPVFEYTTGSLFAPITAGYYRDANGNMVAGRDVSNGTAWWLGVGAELTRFDPFYMAFDAYYSAISDKSKYNRRSGWYLAGMASYKTQYGTPALKAWYSSGDKKNPNSGSNRALTISPWFDATTSFFGGEYSLGDYTSHWSHEGTWGVSLRWDNLSFVNDLYHSLAVTYFRGTNAQRNIRNVYDVYGYHMNPNEYMTTADSAVEVDFTSTYNIYKNLAAQLELGYVFQNFNSRLRAGQKFTNGWNVAVNFKYTF